MITFQQFQELESQIRVCDPEWSGFKGKYKNTDEPRDHYVYVFLDTRKPGDYPYCEFSFDYEVFYVGKGKGKRAYVSHTKRKNVLVSRIIRKCKEAGLPAKGRLIQTGLTEEQAFRLEKHLIASIGRRCDGLGPLANFTKGGEGFSGSSPKIEAKRKRNWYKAMNSRTPEQKAATLEKQREHWTKERRAETGKRFSVSLAGKKKSPEELDKRRATYAKPEWKIAHSNRMKAVVAKKKEEGTWVSPCKFRKPLSAKARASISEKAKLRWARWKANQNENVRP